MLLALQLVLLGIAGVAFVEWLYQSRINLRAFGVRRLRYPRVWAVGGFLVPALNLVRPYQVVREVWQASDPRTQDPFAWSQLGTGRLLPAWWAATVVWVVLALASLLFCSGLLGLMVRRNIIFVLMSLEVMLNSAALAFVAAGAYWGQPDGQVMFMLILTVTAAPCTG